MFECVAFKESKLPNQLLIFFLYAYFGNLLKVTRTHAHTQHNQRSSETAVRRFSVFVWTTARKIRRII